MILLMPSIYIFIVVCLVSIQAQTPENFTEQSTLDRPIILTRDGAVRGRRAKTVGQQVIYYAFKGIPYAEPPIGERRFKAPERKSRWWGVLNTTEDKNQCLQYGSPSQGSEDCLYINVYTPNLLGRRLPVMAWIYGGGFVFGNSTYDQYAPDYLLEEGVVFVSFNYRLGIYGFGSTEDSVCPGNFGLKDQILALKWIQDNILRFGGDPGKVTIFGQSAGSASVSYLLQTSLTKDLFRAAIMESGASVCLWALDRKSRQSMFTVGQLLNVDTSSSTSLINGLRKIDARQLENVAFAVSINATVDNLLGGIIFSPVKEAGVVEKYSEQALFEGRFHRKPVIIGITSNEVGSLGSFADPVRLYFERFENNETGLVPIDLTRNSSKISQAASQIRKFYFGTAPISGQADAIVDFINDDFFYRPIRRTVIDQSKYVPVYYYKFSYYKPLNGTVKGATHASELPYLFSRTIDNITANDKLIRSRMVKMWTNFAKFSDPTPSPDPLLENVTWFKSSTVPNNQLYLDIDTDMELQLNPFNRRMKFWDRIYQQFGDPPHDTY